ncbi:AraC family transcriptional regulator [Konateibacter massiliensis]|uniref:AraC family transcriptional regulator n=1 Tax=Konateibacter massiliensis TaxID=2002841 RepID=UPI000C1456E2
MFFPSKCRISHVGDILSFENAYYFARVFKRYKGITPSEYQEKNLHKRQKT